MLFLVDWMALHDTLSRGHSKMLGGTAVLNGRPEVGKLQVE